MREGARETMDGIGMVPSRGARDTVREGARSALAGIGTTLPKGARDTVREDAQGTLAGVGTTLPRGTRDTVREGTVGTPAGRGIAGGWMFALRNERRSGGRGPETVQTMGGGKRVEVESVKT